MARTHVMYVTPDTGTVEVTHGTRIVTLTVLTGAVELRVTEGLFRKRVWCEPAGPGYVTAEITDTNAPVPEGYVIRLNDPRTSQQRRTCPGNGN